MSWPPLVPARVAAVARAALEAVDKAGLESIMATSTWSQEVDTVSLAAAVMGGMIRVDSAFA